MYMSPHPLTPLALVVVVNNSGSLDSHGMLESSMGNGISYGKVLVVSPSIASNLEKDIPQCLLRQTYHNLKAGSPM